MAWTFATPAAAVPEGGVLGVDCLGRRLAVYHVDGEFFATSDLCPHQGASLSSGCVVQGHIECPVHYALFDIRSGAADGAVTTHPLRTFPTRVENDAVHVDLEP